MEFREERPADGKVALRDMVGGKWFTFNGRIYVRAHHDCEETLALNMGNGSVLRRRHVGDEVCVTPIEPIGVDPDRTIVWQKVAP